MELDQITVEELVDAFPVRKRRGEKVHMTNRYSCGIAIATQGSYLYTMGEETLPSDGRHVLFLPQSGSYQFHCLEDDESLLINFRAAEHPSRILSIPVQDAAPLMQCYQSIRESLGLPGRRAFCMAQLYKALFLLTKETEPAVKNAQVAQAVSYIERSLGRRELSNELLASALHMSTASFRKQFTQAMGVSPMRYVLIRRMEYAKQLLQEGGCTVGQAAEQCGFANIYYFSNVFKSQTGVAPSQYAKRFTQI